MRTRDENKLDFLARRQHDKYLRKYVRANVRTEVQTSKAVSLLNSSETTAFVSAQIVMYVEKMTWTSLPVLTPQEHDPRNRTVERELNIAPSKV